MEVVTLIQKKRDGIELSKEELSFLVKGFVDGSVKDYHMAAWLMAAFLKGLSPSETSSLTELMWKSGTSLPRKDTDFWVDKHSTGGVGDKTSLILVPWVASTCTTLFGENKVRLPMISGRGLGRCGGTLDKLDAVEGFSSRLNLKEALPLLEKNGFFMMGQTEELAPADKKIYSLRDVTGTVESIPLIVASIMSKKLSESLNGLVLNVTCGEGAFMADVGQAKILAKALLEVAKRQNITSHAVISRMDEPLGRAAGHLIEVVECENFLSGSEREAGLYEVTEALAFSMVELAGRGKVSKDEILSALKNELESGRPLRLYRKMFESQGGKWESYEKAREELKAKTPRVGLKAEAKGYVSRISGRRLANLLLRLGGGRIAKEDEIDPYAGVWCDKKVGMPVEKGETLLKVYFRKKFDTKEIENELRECATVGPTNLSKPNWIIEIMK